MNEEKENTIQLESYDAMYEAQSIVMHKKWLIENECQDISIIKDKLRCKGTKGTRIESHTAAVKGSGWSKMVKSNENIYLGVERRLYC